MSTKNTFSIVSQIVAVSVIGLSSLMVSNTAIAKPNGKDTTIVQYRSGSFEKIDQNTWYEYKSGSKRPHTIFKKTHDDQWSIYLNDASRNVQLQLDMHRMMVGYSENNGSKRDLYKITSADNRVNGRLATQVNVAQGSFVKRGNDWHELSGDGSHRYTFKETDRDMWSIYGRDGSRSMDIQIDLHRNKIRLAWPGHPMQDQYNVTSSR